MADLSALLAASPTVAGFMMGENQAMSQQTERLRQQELAQTLQKIKMEMEHTKSLHPLKLEQQRLLNQAQDAQIPGWRADSRNKEVTAKVAEATQGSTISSTNAINSGKTTEAQLKQLQESVGAFRQIGALLSGPEPHPGAHAAALREALLKGGMKEDSDAFRNLMGQVQQVGPQGIGSFFTNIANQIMKTDPKHLSEMAKQESVNETNRKIQQGHDATSKYVADKRAQVAQATAAAKSTATDIWQKLQSGKMSTEQALVAISGAIMSDPDEANQAMYNQLYQTLQALQANKAAQPKPGQVDPESVGMSAQQPPPPVPAPQRPAASASRPAAPGSETGRLKSGNSFTIVPTQ